LRLLLDTHVLLWAMVDPGHLTDAALDVVRDGRHEVFASAASVWEIEINRAAGRLKAPDDLIDVLIASGFRPLPMSLEHARTAGSLPRHHRDPFDRMLIAQAQVESLTIATRDERFAPYKVQLLAA
jgi:PIN domain nuclease of toxin-antitoxin system